MIKRVMKTCQFHLKKTQGFIYTVYCVGVSLHGSRSAESEPRGCKVYQKWGKRQLAPGIRAGSHLSAGFIGTCGRKYFIRLHGGEGPRRRAENKEKRGAKAEPLKRRKVHRGWLEDKLGSRESTAGYEKVMRE